MDIEKVEAAELKRGSLYAVQVNTVLSAEAMGHIKAQLAPFEQRYGVGFLVFGSEVSIRGPITAVEACAIRA